MPISADRISQFKRTAKRTLPVGLAIAAGAAVLTGSPRPAESSPLEMTFQGDTSLNSAIGEECSFKIGAVSVWLKSEPPADLKNAGNPLWQWALDNNQLGGPAGDRTIDISAQANDRAIGTMTTDYEGIARADSGSKLIRANAPKQIGVQRYFEGVMRDTALVKLLDKATNRTHIHEVLCGCIYNARVPRWMNANTPPTPTPAETQIPAEVPAAPTPTPAEVCPPAFVQLPCNTKDSLFNPNKVDAEPEVGRSTLGEEVLVMTMPARLRANIVSLGASRS